MKLRLLIASLLVTTLAGAQLFTGLYNFAGVTTSSGTTDPSVVPAATGVTFGSFTAVGTPANPNATGRFSFAGWPLGATNGSNTFTGSINLAQYYQVTITPQANFKLNLDSITFTFQRSSTGVRQYVVRSSVDAYAGNLPAFINPANAALQVVVGNTFQIDDVSTVANDGSTVRLSGYTDIATPVTFRFYGFNAEGTGGTFSIDNVRFMGEALSISGSSVITINTSSFLFPSTATGATAPIQWYTVMGENLVANLDVATAAPFSLSTDSLSFSPNLSLTPAEVAVPKKIFVKFSPAVTGSFADTIVHTSSSATTKKISLSGEGINPANFSFNFDACTSLGVPGTGFISYSVTGAQVWNCTTFGRNTTNGVNMNGFFGGSLDNEDWLISPPFDLSGFALPVLSFYSRAEFSGLPLELLVSTNYNGNGNPNAATWTALNGDFPVVGSNVWTLSDNINLSAYKSFPKVFIAYKYISSPVLGSPRWTLDDISITNRTQLFSTNPATIDLGETTVGTSSAGQAISLQAIGYGDISITAPSGFEVSANNITTYSTSIIVPQATAEAGTTVYVRFTPVAKTLKTTGQLTFTGSGFSSTRINLSASSYPKSETFDVVTYNMKFFGSNPTNNATQPQKETQKNNMKIVYDHLNADVIGFQEVSSDSLLGKLVEILPGYAAIISQRWSGSYLPPSPDFPPQKTGFIYKTSTMQLLETRVMFEGLYDSARAGFNTIPGYPTGSGSSFWASGRLPFMATFNATINGITKKIRCITIHAKSGSGASQDYQRRVYDARVLKDSLDTYYANDSIILVGDYNDDLLVSGYLASVSPYKIFMDDSTHYKGVTLPISTAGRPTFIGSSNGGTIDHHIITNELVPYFITNSADIEDPRIYVANYSSTTSDHLPVFSRYDFTNAPLPVTITSISATLIGKEVQVSWATATEINSSHFVVERSVDGTHFGSIGKVSAAGNSTLLNQYRFTDIQPVDGINYYRIKSVDADGRFAYTAIVKVSVSNGGKIVVRVFPNPVSTSMQVTINAGNTTITNWQLISGDGKILLQGKGTAASVNAAINQNLYQLHAGMYLLKAELNGKLYISKFIKE